MEYNKYHITIIKGLQAAWWHHAEKVWLAKATLANLEILQKEFKSWAATEYDKIRDLVSLMEFPRKVELYKTLDSPGNVWIKLSGYGIDVDFLKHMPERAYDQRFNRWSIPNDAILTDRVITHYEKQRVEIVNRIPKAGVEYQKSVPSYGDRKKLLLTKFDIEFRPLVKECCDVLVAQRYSWRTVQSYIGPIVKFAEQLGERSIHQASAQDLNLYLSKIYAQKVSESMLNRIVNALKFFYTKVIFRPDFELDKIKRPQPTILATSNLLIQAPEERNIY